MRIWKDPRPWNWHSFQAGNLSHTYSRFMGISGLPCTWSVDDLPVFGVDNVTASFTTS